MFDLKVINSVLEQLEEERGIPKERIIEAIEAALATAYKKEYGKRGQVVRTKFDMATGTTDFEQVKTVVDETLVKIEEEEELDGDAEKANVEATSEESTEPEDERVRFDAEKHIMVEDAKKIKKDVQLEEEMVFPLETKDDYGRIAAQTAKQVIIQKIREAEKVSVMNEYGERQGEIVNGTVQRIERGNIFVDLTRATGIMPYDEQIPGERYKQGERIRAYLYRVEESPKGLFLKLSRSHPQFLKELFQIETPELTNGSVEIKAIAREAGSRSKVAVESLDEHIDPVGSLVGQRGVRVATVMSELNGEKIDIIEWAEEPVKFIEDSLSPAKVVSVEVNTENHSAVVMVNDDQQSLAIGKGGQNVRLAAKLTGWKIDIQSDGNNSEGYIAPEEAPVKEAEEPVKTEETPAEVAEKPEESTETPEVTEEKTEEKETKEEEK